MTKLIAAIMAALFAVATVSPVAFAADDKKTTSDKKPTKKGDKEEAKK